MKPLQFEKNQTEQIVIVKAGPVPQEIMQTNANRINETLKSCLFSDRNKNVLVGLCVNV